MGPQLFCFKTKSALNPLLLFSFLSLKKAQLSFFYLTGAYSKTDTPLLLLESLFGEKQQQVKNSLHCVPVWADVGPVIIHCFFSSLAHGFLFLYVPNYL